MSRHGERIHKRKDGRWEGRYKIGNDPSGRTLYSSVYGKTYTETKAKLFEAESNQVRYTVPISKGMHFKDAVWQWFSINKHKYKGATAYKYEYLIFRHILPRLGHLPMQSLSVVTINEFANYELTSGRLNGTGGLSKAYVRSMMLIINSVIKFSAQEGWCREFTPYIYKPSPDPKKLNILSRGEQCALETALLSENSLAAVGILIALYTGLRIGEICALTWKNVDLENNILHIRSTVSRIGGNDKTQKTTLIIDNPKTKTSARDIPVSHKLHEILTNVKSNTTSQFVISNSETFMSPRTFEYQYRKIMRENHLPDLNFHSLRHTFATRCIENGMDAKSVSEILGHANVSITLNTYVHSSMQQKRECIEKMSALSNML